MFKLITALVVAVLTPQQSNVDVVLAQKVLSQSVLIRIKMHYTTDEGTIKYGMGGCSGTYIGPQTVLTAAHCFSSGFTQIWIRGYGVGSHEAVLIKIDPAHDLALLAVKGPFAHATAKIGANPAIGDDVINVGSPVRMEFLVSQGIVAQKEFIVREFKSSYLVTTAMINPGSSGGGAFNNKGELIGVNTMTIGSPFGWSGISLAVSVYDIKEFLR